MVSFVLNDDINGLLAKVLLHHLGYSSRLETVKSLEASPALVALHHHAVEAKAQAKAVEVEVEDLLAAAVESHVVLVLPGPSAWLCQPDQE